jgi:hypothetical protein
VLGELRSTEDGGDAGMHLLDEFRIGLVPGVGEADEIDLSDAALLGHVEFEIQVARKLAVPLGVGQPTLFVCDLAVVSLPLAIEGLVVDRRCW